MDLKMDFVAIFRQNPKRFNLLIVARKYNTSMPFRVVVIYRVSHLMLSRGHRLLAMLLHRHLYETLHADISPSAAIGSGLRIPHPVGIVIGDHVSIGENAVIMQGVTLGGNFSKKNDGRTEPLVGKNVFIGPNAVVLGPVTIGDNVKIGANSVVTKSFADDVVVVGSPARCLYKANVTRNFSTTDTHSLNGGET